MSQNFSAGDVTRFPNLENDYAQNENGSDDSDTDFDPNQRVVEDSDSD